MTTKPPLDELTELIRWAKVLHQNSMGCASEHHGHDMQLHGVPGWLADAQKAIVNAEASFREQSPPPTGTVRANALEEAMRKAIDQIAHLQEQRARFTLEQALAGKEPS